MVFNHPYSKIIEMLGGKASTENESGLINCIALTNFLMEPEFTILGADLEPEYGDFKQDDWVTFRADNCTAVFNEYRQALNTNQTYEMNLKSKCIRACSLCSKSSSKTKAHKIGSKANSHASNASKTPSVSDANEVPNMPKTTRNTTTATLLNVAIHKTLLSGEKEDYPAIKASVIGEDNGDAGLNDLPGLLPRSQNPRGTFQLQGRSPLILR
jgi:hypothetical protein